MRNVRCYGEGNIRETGKKIKFTVSDRFTRFGLLQRNVAFDEFLVKDKHSIDDPPPKRAAVLEISPEGGKVTLHEGHRMNQLIISEDETYFQQIKLVEVLENAKLPNHEAIMVLDRHLDMLELVDYLDYIRGERNGRPYDEWKDYYKIVYERTCEHRQKADPNLPRPTLREVRESVDAEIKFPYEPVDDQPEERLIQALKDIIVNDKPLQLGGETTTMELVKRVAQTSPYDSVREAARRRLIEYLGELKAKAYIEVYTGPTNPRIEAELENGIQ